MSLPPIIQSPLFNSKFFSGSNDYITFTTGDQRYLRYGGSGTLAANAIANPSGLGQTYQSWTNSSTSLLVELAMSSTASTFGNTSNHPMILRTNGANRIWISETGPIGINTNSPSEILDVTGNVRINSSSGAVYKLKLDNSSTGYSSLYNSGANTDVILDIGNGNSLKAFVVQNRLLSSGTLLKLSAFSSENVSFKYGITGGYSMESTSDFALVMNGVNQIQFNLTGANIGILNSSPNFNYDLDINANTRISKTLQCFCLCCSDACSRNCNLSRWGYYKAQRWDTTTASPIICELQIPSVATNNSGIPCIGTLTSDAFGIMTGNTIRLSVGTSGRVGINTNTPVCALQVVGSSSFTITNIAINTFQYNVSSNSWTNLGGGPVSITISAHFSSNIYVSQSVYTSSDRRLKKDIKPFEIDVDHYAQLEPVSYTFKNDSKPKLGLIAQDVLKVCGEMVGIAENENMKVEQDGDLEGAQYTVDYAALSVLNCSVINKLINRVKELEETMEKVIEKPALAKWLTKSGSPNDGSVKKI
ncbi:Intramolecular chaperone auto-processing domain [Phytophthora cactorum]|nr:Intramolecular chaperone auto-processing domain [Phytophthora cactorum]